MPTIFAILTAFHLAMESDEIKTVRDFGRTNAFDKFNECKMLITIRFIILNQCFH